MEKFEVDIPIDRICHLRLERQMALAKLPTVGYVNSVVKKSKLLDSKLSKSAEDERTLELLSCWRKLSIEKQEIILGIVIGLKAATAI